MKKNFSLLIFFVFMFLFQPTFGWLESFFPTKKKLKLIAKEIHELHQEGKNYFQLFEENKDPSFLLEKGFEQQKRWDALHEKINLFYKNNQASGDLYILYMIKEHLNELNFLTNNFSSTFNEIVSTLKQNNIESARKRFEREKYLFGENGFECDFAPCYEELLNG